jgi:CRISPR-associated protein Cmr6
MRIQKNKFFNKDFRGILESYLAKEIKESKFGELNFFYIYNMPEVKSEKGSLKIRINEEIDKFKWNWKFLDDFEKRRRNLIEELKKNGYICFAENIQIKWRLIVGLGASHPQETSMTLHHIYGIPYIPGSAIKGVTRHWAVLKFAEELSRREKKDFEIAVEEVSKALEDGKGLDELKVGDLEFSQLIEIFGTQKQQGKVIFFNAYPIGDINLKIDVMNPHYPEYYSKGQAPTDWQNPIPIKFLTVENTKFQFYLAVRGENSNKILEKTKELCLKALKEHGIGAKTSLGYGIFEEINT